VRSRCAPRRTQDPDPGLNPDAGKASAPLPGDDGVDELVAGPALLGPRLAHRIDVHDLARLSPLGPVGDPGAVRVAGLDEVGEESGEGERRLAVCRLPGRRLRIEGVEGVLDVDGVGRAEAVGAIRLGQYAVETIAVDRRLPRPRVDLNLLPGRAGDEEVAGQIGGGLQHLGVVRRCVDVRLIRKSPCQ